MSCFFAQFNIFNHLKILLTIAQSSSFEIQMSNLANLVKKGRKQFLLYQGFYYKKFKKISSKELWSCEEYQCPCKLETSTEGELKIVESITEHKHINENLSEISILNGFKPNYVNISILKSFLLRA